MSKRILTCLIIFISAWACDDVIVKDIHKKTVVLKAPSDAWSTQDGNLLFWWEELDGASAYEVLIASPNTSNPSILVLDSTVAHNTFSFTLSQGEYEWCVRGVNNGYRTQYACRMVFVVP